MRASNNKSLAIIEIMHVFLVSSNYGMVQNHILDANDVDFYDILRHCVALVWTQ